MDIIKREKNVFKNWQINVSILNLRAKCSSFYCSSTAKTEKFAHLKCLINKCPTCVYLVFISHILAISRSHLLPCLSMHCCLSLQPKMKYEIKIITLNKGWRKNFYSRMTLPYWPAFIGRWYIKLESLIHIGMGMPLNLFDMKPGYFQLLNSISIMNPEYISRPSRMIDFIQAKALEQSPSY